ncbi:hypothetical protein GCM10022396_26540 [Flavivirga amylovorans]
MQQKYAYQRTIETHISWILLCKEYAFKIKKPLKLKFLDYSEVSKREFYCKRELSLNDRFAPNVYLNVLPINNYQNQFKLEGTHGSVVDYAVMMKRLDDASLLSNRIKNDTLKELDILNLSTYIYKIHKAANICSGFSTSKLEERLNQVLELKDIIREKIGNAGVYFTQEIITTSSRFLKIYKELFKNRIEQNYIRNVHGDLHFDNIFIDDQDIVLIDCIEFEDSYSQIDLLDDVASILVDFDFYKRPNDAVKFMNLYVSYYDNSKSINQALLNYYKMQRSVTRFSVCLLKDDKESLVNAKKYQALMKQYKDLICKAF